MKAYKKAEALFKECHVREEESDSGNEDNWENDDVNAKFGTITNNEYDSKLKIYFNFDEKLLLLID